jgi:TetR/AcrR family transcriptional regulator, mexJK operon transcriptional repressor
MSTVRPNLYNDLLRRRDPEQPSDSVAPTRSVTEIVRSLAEGRAKPRAKEQEVLDVATAYFLRHGYQGASINAMARSSGISKESIYRYFSSKKQLFEAVICRELVEYRHVMTRLDATLKTMDLRTALITIAETVLNVITTDRTLALRRLIFEEARRSPDVGQHYYQIGPEQAYVVLENVFTSRRADSDFSAAVLSRHFVALVTWRIVLERECAVSPALTKVETRACAETIVEDFLKAFLRQR